MTGVVPVEEFAALADVAGAVVEMFQERNAELQSQVDDLAERMAGLERKLSRNSGNSGMPPSADDLPGNVPPEPKPKRDGKKRKPGKQEGAPGAHLAWSEDPDEKKDLFPEGPVRLREQSRGCR